MMRIASEFDFTSAIRAAVYRRESPFRKWQRAPPAAAASEDNAITGTLIAADVDSAAPTLSRVGNAAHGNVTVNSDGTFSYTPDLDSRAL